MVRGRWIAASLALLACGVATGLWALQQRPIAVSVAGIGCDVPIRVFGLGTIEARITSRVGFEVNCTLAEVLVDHGDRIPAGTVLARLNPVSQQARVAKAEAGLQNAEAQQARAAATVDRTTALLQQKRATSQRRRQLTRGGTTSPEAAEIAETEAVAAAADLAVPQADLGVARAALADARANLLSERTTLAKHVLTAPYDALVVARLREAGSALVPGEVVFTLVAPTSLWVLAYIDEGRAGAIREGQPAAIRLRSLPGEVFPARVVRIGLESDRVTEERRINIRCERCPPQPVIGEQVQVEVETGRVATARLGPETAVEGFDGASGRVWTVVDGVLQQRQVSFVARTLDARLALDPALPAEIAVATQVLAGFQPGRAARALP